MKIFDVYLDKRKMGKSNLRSYSLRNSKSQIVEYKSDFIILKDVDLVVQNSGYEATVKSAKKYVHAFLRGTCVYRGRNAKKIMSKLDAFNPENRRLTNVGYNPFITNKWLKIPSFSINQIKDSFEQYNSIDRGNFALIHNQGICMIDDINLNDFR